MHAKWTVVLLVVSLLVGLLACELLLRLAWENPYAGSGTEHILEVHLHHRDMDQRLDRRLIDSNEPTVTYRTSPRAYIQPSHRFERPDATILFLGASTLECIAVAEPKRPHALVSERLASNGLRVNVLNAARSGGTLHDSINVLLNHGIQDNPDIVVLMHAVNDVGVLAAQGDYSSRMSREVNLVYVVRYVVQMVSIRSSLAGLLRHTLMAPELDTDPGLERDAESVASEPFRQRLEAYVGLCRAFDLEPVIVTQPHVSSMRTSLTPGWYSENALDSFNSVARAVADSTGTIMIDLAAHVSEETLERAELERIFYDGLHVTDYGAVVYASYLTEGLRGLCEALARDE